MIKLEKITEDNYKECLKLKVAEDQTKFVSSTTLSLAKAYVFRDIVTPFAIYNDGIMVRFIMMRFNKEYSNYFIWQFIIHEKYQFKGYGKHALKLAMEWMKKDNRCHDIVTTYILGNETAKNLYTKFGFEQMGEALDGGVDMILHL